MRNLSSSPAGGRPATWLLRCGAALLCLTMAQGVAAQDAAGSAAAAAPDDSGLVDIVVTATKRNETVLRAPVSVTALSGAAINDIGSTSLSQIDTRIPNLRVSESIAFPSVTMRGVGSGTGTSSFDQTVSVFNDGVYAARSRQFLLPFFDVDHIEVLRGPQGAIVGKNTSAGAIVIVSAQPTPELSGSLDANYNFTLHQPTVTGVISGPLGGGFGFRLAGQYDQRDRGYLYDTATDSHDPRWKAGIIRGILDYDGGDFTGNLKVEYSKRNLKGSFLQAAVPNNPAYALDYTSDAGGGGPLFDNLENVNVALNLSYDTGIGTLSSITGYSWYDSLIGLDPDGISQTLVYANIGENYHQFSQELRFSSKIGEPLELVSGVYYQRYHQNAWRWAANYLNLPGSYRVNFDQHDEAVSAFAELLWHITPEVSVRAGGRYTYETKWADYSQIIGLDSAAGIGIPAPATPFSDSLAEGLFDPAVVLQWEPSGSTMFYASFTRGSKGGAFQGDVAGASIDSYAIGPERATSYEAGTKFRFLNGRGRLGITLFNTKYSALQLAEIDPNIINSVVFRVRNAGEAVSRGVEVEGALQATDWLTFNASASYLDAHYTNYQAGDCAPGQTPNGSKPGTCSYNGVDMPFAPHWNGNVSADVRVPVVGDWDLFGNGNVQFSSTFRTNTTDDPMSIQKGYAKVDLTVGVRNEHWRVAVMMRNLTDHMTQSWATLTPPAAFAGGLGQDARLFKVDEPRTIALQVRYQF